MEFNLIKEAISANENIYNGTLELGVETDYVLPDYLPDINRILKCKLIPRITSKQIHGEKITIDGYSLIRLMYLSEDLKSIKIAEIKIPFSKNCDIKSKEENLLLSAVCKTDYCNCRVINQRRIDVRGAVSIALNVNAQKENIIVSDASGDDIQLKKEATDGIKMIGNATKQFSVQDEMSLTEADSLITEILNLSAIGEISDAKIISNKVILKGEIKMKVFCQKVDDGSDTENSFTYITKIMPFSQIVDIEGVDENAILNIATEIVSAEGELISENTQSSDGVDFNVTLMLTIKAYKKIENYVITDAYSIKHPCKYKTESIPFEQNINRFCENFPIASEFDLSEEEIHKVFDANAEINNIKSQFSDGIITFTGDVSYAIIAQNTSNEIVLCEKSESFEFKKQIETVLRNVFFDGEIKILSAGDFVLSEKKISLKSVIEISGMVIGKDTKNVINSIELDYENEKQSTENSHFANAALIIYYAQKGETLWDIAKKYNTKQEKILQENGIEDDVISDEKMLLIPTEI